MRDRVTPFRVIIVTAVITSVIMGYLYASITVLDKKTRPLHLVQIGMTKTEVVAVIGEPDWKEGQDMWAYRVRGDGFWGILMPNYFQFDENGILTNAWS